MVRSILLALICTLACGCGDESDEDIPIDELPIPTAGASEQSGTVSELRRKLGIGDDGAFLKVGGEIRIARLPGTNVTDLSPLAGLPLRERGLILVGTPDSVSRQMEQMLKHTPIRWLFAWTYNGLTPHDKIMRSLELFSTKVLPRFSNGA